MNRYALRDARPTREEIDGSTGPRMVGVPCVAHGVVDAGTCSTFPFGSAKSLITLSETRDRLSRPRLVPYSLELSPPMPSVFVPWRLVAAALLAFAVPGVAVGELITYQYAGEITEVTQNQDNVIPNLSVGDVFTGYVTFESTGWHRTAGIVFAKLNGVDLLFTGQYIFGNVAVEPARYAIRIAGDTGGAISGSTFNAGNFGPDLADSNGSAGYSQPFPPSLDLDEFELNVFRISGTVLATNDGISANGRLTQFTLVPEPATAASAAGGALCLLRRRRRMALGRRDRAPGLKNRHEGPPV